MTATVIRFPATLRSSERRAWVLLAQDGPLTVEELAGRMGLLPTSAAELIRCLSRRGEVWWDLGGWRLNDDEGHAA